LQKKWNGEINLRPGCRRFLAPSSLNHVAAFFGERFFMFSKGRTMKRAAQGNGYDSTQLEGFLKKLDAADSTLATLKAEYMLKCKGPRADMTGVFEAAREAGVPMRAFRTLVKNRRLNRKIENNTAALEPDDAAEYDQLTTALGDFVDLPLGQAALDRARPNQEQALDSLA
jgi:hypothetical protein